MGWGRTFHHGLILVGVFGAVFGCGWSSGRAAGTFPMQARVWDIEMTIPAGAYRSPKPIEVTGAFTETIEPGAFLDGVAFGGTADAQQWKIRGAFLRKVRISGQLGVNLEAHDSVLEECSFYKDSSWYVQWWSTRWRFKNCLFTKRFIREDLPPLDYEAHAERCTFYGVSLPPVGMKENPASYLQKNHMAFVKCRFVQCEVPETFLAATVDCVFEACQFSSKRHPWPKETTAIRVNAYYTGLGSPPKSFINGPLSVQFSPATEELEVGSTLPHTRSGGRLALTGQREPAQFTMIGITPKKASEIPFSEKPVSELPARPPNIPAVPPKPPAPSAGTGEVRSLDEMLLPLPTGIELIKSGALHVDGVDAANRWLAETYTGRPASLQMVFEGAQAHKEEGYAFRAIGRNRPLNSRGVSVAASVTALFRPEAAGALARVTKGNILPVRGVVQKATLEGRGRSLELIVTVGEAQVR